jgi:hypothetical protein
MVFLLGNQVTQIVFACRLAAKHGRNVFAAGLRGFMNLQLAYLESKRCPEGGTEVAAATAASLNHKMIELMWELPQTVIALSVLMSNLIVRKGQQPDPSFWMRLMGLGNWAAGVQFVTTVVGLASLSLGALDFLRLHPMSYWASAQAAERLFLWLIDISKDTWLRSLVIGVYAAASVISRASFYTLTMFLWSIHSIGLGNVSAGSTSPAYFVVLLAGVFVVCLLLLLPLILNKCSLDVGGYELSPPATWVVASALSTFINVPWVTAPVGTDEWKGRYYWWPSWVMAFLFPPISMAFGTGLSGFGTFDYCSPDAPFIGLTNLVPGLMPLFIVLPLVTGLVEVGCFLGMSGWVTEQRRRFWCKKLAVLHFAEEVLALSYTFSWSTLTSTRD